MEYVLALRRGYVRRNFVLGPFARPAIDLRLDAAATL